MSKNVLTEGMIDTVVMWFMRGTVNKATKEFVKNPEVKKAVNNFNIASDELKASIARMNKI
mgnify:CR=1 FL=1